MPASLVAIPSITRISDQGNACILPNVLNVSPQPCVFTPLKASRPNHHSHQDPGHSMPTAQHCVCECTVPAHLRIADTCDNPAPFV